MTFPSQKMEVVRDMRIISREEISPSVRSIDRFGEVYLDNTGDTDFALSVEVLSHEGESWVAIEHTIPEATDEITHTWKAKERITINLESDQIERMISALCKARDLLTVSQKGN
jgi:hypothetical protein